MFALRILSLLTLITQQTTSAHDAHAAELTGYNTHCTWRYLAAFAVLAILAARSG